MSTTASATFRFEIHVIRSDQNQFWAKFPVPIRYQILLLRQDRRKGHAGEILTNKHCQINPKALWQVA